MKTLIITINIPIFVLKPAYRTITILKKIVNVNPKAIPVHFISYSSKKMTNTNAGKAYLSCICVGNIKNAKLIKVAAFNRTAVFM